VKVEIKDIDQVTKELTLTVSSEDTQVDYRKALSQVAKMAMVPGYRKGKAPLSMVERMYGETAREEYLRQNLEKYYVRALDENKISPINEAELVSSNWDGHGDLSATFKFEIDPTPQITNWQNIEVPFKDFPLEKEVDEYINRLRSKFASMQDIDDEIRSDDYVDLTLTWNDGEERFSRNHSVSMHSAWIESEYYQKLLGQRIGYTFNSHFEIDVEEHDHEEEEHAHNHEKMTVEAEAIVNAVRRINLPVLDDDFAKDADFDSLEDMKAKVAEELKDRNESMNKNMRRDAILKKIYELNPFDLPKSFAMRLAYNAAEPLAKAYNMPIEQVMPYYIEQAKSDVRNYYLIRELEKMLAVAVSDEEKEQKIVELASSRNVTVDDFKSDKNFDIQDIENLIKEQKIFAELDKNTKFVEPSIEEAEKLAAEVNEELEELE